MSKIGKMPVTIAEGVTAAVADKKVTVTGPKGVLSFPIPAGIQVAVEDGKIVRSKKVRVTVVTRNIYSGAKICVA